jgi:hypothetical protein
MRFEGRWSKGKYIASYDHPCAVRVEKDGNDYIVRPDEVETWAEHERTLQAERLETARLRYGPELRAWGEGAKTPGLMAEELGIDSRQASNKLRAMRRWGLVS